jgi:predicted signal transduction protein with EAL and GGDEF domain
MHSRGMKDGPAQDAKRFAGSQSDVDHRRTMESELMKLALDDSLTGLPNRTAFLERLGHAFERARRRTESASIAVAFLDIDQFKHINESLGHLQGDNLLKNVAKRLEETLLRAISVGQPGQARPTAEASSSPPSHDDSIGKRLDWTLARTGGDEFAILLENIGSKDEVVQLVDIVQSAFQEPFKSETHDLFITLSAGIQFGPHGSERPDDLLRDADTAMYSAKAAGRGECQVFTRNMRSNIEEQLRMESQLQIALRDEEFTLVYQPVVTLGKQKLEGFEALIRWQHPERGLLPPGQFIHLAEETGAIIDIGRWAIAEAFRQFARWQADHPRARSLFISVNISRKQLCDESIVADISSACHAVKLDPKQIHLEITESLVLDRPVDSCALLERLRDEGFKVSIDDFGTGHSSLYTVQTLPADILKIDRSFVCQLGKSRTASRIVATILALAKALGHKVIAEGVETEKQRAELERLGCRLSQGFLFYRPMPPAQIESDLLQRADRATPKAPPLIQA